MEVRMDELSGRYEAHCRTIADLKEKNHKLGLGFVSYEKVNRELVEEL